VSGEFQPKDDAQADRLRYLEQAFASYWQNRGNVAEAFGHAWAKAGNFEEAIRWYERARTAEDGGASLATIEQLANARVRVAWSRLEQNANATNADRNAARAEILDALTLLDTLVIIGPTIERESIYGSAYKRLALIEGAAGRAPEEADAIQKMMERYNAAEQIARASAPNATAPNKALFYPAMNRIAARLALSAGAADAPPLEDATFAEVRRSMAAAAPDFWSVVGQTELDMYEAVAGANLRDAVGTLIADFERHHTLVNVAKRWTSVYDNAVFVLSKYRQRTDPVEAAAVDHLLWALAALAGRSVPSAASESSRGTS
jgi:tetratricopeptide (TPR) repeat protein